MSTRQKVPAEMERPEQRPLTHSPLRPPAHSAVEEAGGSEVHPSPSQHVAQLQFLQRTIGNRAVQRLLAGQKPQRQDGPVDSIQKAAARGIQTPSMRLPFLETLQPLFGRHDLSQVQAHVGSEAAASATAMNARAYATGNHVVFAGSPDLRTTAHEVAHVVQQRAGVQLADGVGQAGDAYERHADAVADRVTSRQSAEGLLQRFEADPVSSAIQREERTTSIYNRVGNTNDFRKGMEIIDSTSVSAYVHLSRDAAPGEDSVNTQQQPHFFNGLQEPTKRSQVKVEGAGAQADLSAYTRANNAHITLEGRYAMVMSSLANGFVDLQAVKSGPPVAAQFANLNFGSYADHGDVQKSQRDIFTYISDYAEQATEIVMQRPEAFEGERNELLEQIDAVEAETRDFAYSLIQRSSLRNLDDSDFVHYGGEEWDPLIRDDIE